MHALSLTKEFSTGSKMQQKKKICQAK